ncbi:25530_t:CDS:10 [Gigaspora margarita]|uniref:25530_t:CDS:1 n=1 Tax=Gigaspora margarita TaxID=4874 RepID=A0ABN7UB77_GIGMA|nr:25530_t:CDS:10 [Gigaspora margarita]
MSKRQYSDRAFSPASSAKKVTCPHIERYCKHGSPVAKIESSAFKRQVSSSTLCCDWCEAKIPRSRCRTVVCSSSSRSHMREHYDLTYKENKPEATHAVYINPRTLNIWCYGCGFEINPFSKDHELSQETPMWSGISPIFAPTRLISEIKKHNEIFQGFSQEDSAEFLRVILDKLDEELPYPQNRLNYTQTNGNIDNLVYLNNSSSLYALYMNTHSPSLFAGVDTMVNDHYASGISSTASSASSITTYEKFQRRHSSPVSIINEIFQGVYESKIKCLYCKKESLKDDYFYVLPIQVDKRFKLKSQEKGSNGVLNNVVGSIGDWLGIGGRTVKLQDCLSAFCATENLTDLDMSPYFKEAKDSSDNSKYSLYGLILHRGGIGGGHYIAYAKNSIDDSWYEFDDTYVTKKTEAEISRLEAYVLFYKKTSPKKEQERQDILSKINDPGPITNYDFICSHGGVNWRVYPKLHDMVVRIPFSVYTLLMEKYGTDGSPTFHADDYGRAGCKICEQEERKLDQRRRKEARDIDQIDTNVINRGECWYLISNTWLQSWHNFKNGGPLPGTIDNTTFLQEDGRPKPGMRRAVNANVWNYFVHAYGGGPICIRGTIDLYSSPYTL